METRIIIHFDSLSEFPVNKNTEITYGSNVLGAKQCFRLVTLLNTKTTIVVCHMNLLKSMQETKILLEGHGYDFESFKWR